MILHELCGRTENHPVYARMEVENGERQYDFLHSTVGASIEMRRPFLSTYVVKALNFQAIVCLHTNAGEYRPCDVVIKRAAPDKDTKMPELYRVQALMDDLVNTVNSGWTSTDPFVLATYVLWQLNRIHPFINGNGRTARAACYFVLCMKFGGWLAGVQILPELLRQNRDEYCQKLRHADTTGDMTPLLEMVIRLFKEQVASAASPADPPGDVVVSDGVLLIGPPEAHPA